VARGARTIPSTGAGLAALVEWTINLPGPVTGNVELAVGTGNLLLDLGANLERFNSTYFSPEL